MSSGQIWAVAALIFGTKVINAVVFSQVNMVYMLDNRQRQQKTNQWCNTWLTLRQHFSLVHSEIHIKNHYICTLNNRKVTRGCDVTPEKHLTIIMSVKSCPQWSIKNILQMVNNHNYKRQWCNTSIHLTCSQWYIKTILRNIYSKSKNSVNIVYCNYKENTSSYNVITECNLPHSLPNVGIIFECLSETLKKHVICKILTFIRSTNTLKIQLH